MKTKKVLFVTQNLEVGGGTSALSSLYSIIKNQYDIYVILLSNVGVSKVTYRDSIIYPSFFVDNYYKYFTNSKGMSKFKIGMVKCIAKLFDTFCCDFEKVLADTYKKYVKEADFVIAFGEGAATTFTQHIKNHHKAAWIHYEVSKNPYSQTLYDLYSKFDNVICVSDTIAEGFRNIYPGLAQKTIAIHNVVDKERVLTMSKIRISEVFDNKVFNIVSLGRFSHVKRFQEIPSIARKLKAEGLNFIWRIIGPECDEYVKIDFFTNIIKYNVADCVSWLGNRVNPYPYLAKSDLLVILSSTEACPMVISEARVVNTPIVATNFNTSYEFIDNGIDGVICSINQLSRNIKYVLSDENFRNRLMLNSSIRLGNDEEAIGRFHKMIDNEKI